MSLARLWNNRRFLVYRNAFVYSSLDKLPPIIASHSVIRKAFEQKEAQLLHNGNVWYLEDHRRRVETFYKTVNFVNGPEIERIEKCLLGRTSNRVARTTVTAVSIIAVLSGIPLNEPSLFLVPFSYIVYMIVFAKRNTREEEMYKKVQCLQFFENVLIDLDYHRILEDLKKE